MTTASVTEHWAEQWIRDGFLPVIDVLTPEEARQCRQAFDGLEREVGRDTAEVRILDGRAMRFRAAPGHALELQARAPGDDPALTHRAARLLKRRSIPDSAARRAPPCSHCRRW